MSLKDPILTELTLEITLKPPLLTSQVLTELFRPQVNLPPVPLASNQQVLSKRRTVSEPGKVNPRTQYYRCQGSGHLASQCPSQTKTLLVEIPIEEIEREDDGEVVVHQQDDDSMPLSKSMNSMGASEL